MQRGITMTSQQTVPISELSRMSRLQSLDITERLSTYYSLGKMGDPPESPDVYPEHFRPPVQDRSSSTLYNIENLSPYYANNRGIHFNSLTNRTEHSRALFDRD